LLGLGDTVYRLSPNSFSMTDILTAPKDNGIVLDTEHLKSVIYNLRPYAKTNGDVANIVGELYYYLGDYEKALKYWKIARNTSKQAELHITTTLKNKMQFFSYFEKDRLFDALQLERLKIDAESTNSDISIAAQKKLFEHFLKKKNLSEAEKYATIPSLKKILFEYYFKKEDYKEAGRFAITPYKKLKLFKKYVEMKKYQDAVHFGFRPQDFKTLSTDEKSLFLMPEVRAILDQKTIREIIVVHQEDNTFINKALLEKLLQEDKNENNVNQTAVTILKNKSLLATKNYLT